MPTHPILYRLNFVFFFSLTIIALGLSTAMDFFCDILFATENALTGSKAKIFSPSITFSHLPLFMTTI